MEYISFNKTPDCHIVISVLNFNIYSNSIALISNEQSILPHTTYSSAKTAINSIIIFLRFLLEQKKKLHIHTSTKQYNKTKLTNSLIGPDKVLWLLHILRWAQGRLVQPSWSLAVCETALPIIVTKRDQWEYYVNSVTVQHIKSFGIIRKWRKMTEYFLYQPGEKIFLAITYVAHPKWFY
jgi:hypothetical protein